MEDTMKIRFAISTGLLIALLAAMAVTSVMAQGKAEKKDAEQNVQGSIQAINKDASTITVKVGTTTRVVSHNASTKFLYGHSNDAKAGSLAQVKEGYYISCAGAFDSKGQLMAKECVYRESR
jgi:hypothetical protein